MELYLDTANVAEVERLACIYPLAGEPPTRALSPPVKSRSGMCCRACKKPSVREGTFAQTMSRDAQGMVEEAKRLSNAVPGIVVKIGSPPKGSPLSNC